ncbi:MAG: phospholipase A [Muribaculaceae bacterium]|nr:phospholipase A [Muribaculaceae bacterium]
MIIKYLTLFFVFIACTWSSVQAQIVTFGDQKDFNTDSIRRDFDKRPFFGLYKDNYFTIGTSIGSRPTATNSDVKFQISFAQRLTNSVLPWNTYLYLFYTQKAMWNVFEESLPFHDLNFNPGIGWTKPFFVKGRLVGKASLILEHESNGRDGEASRSWNKISLSGAAFIDPNIMVHAKFWIPIIDGGLNKDILRYSGIYQAGIQGISANKRWVFDITFVKRKGWNLNGNTIINLGFRLFKNHNQFLMLHYYNGYGENLLDYNKFHSRLRIGLLIRPNLFSDF